MPLKGREESVLEMQPKRSAPVCRAGVQFLPQPALALLDGSEGRGAGTGGVSTLEAILSSGCYVRQSRFVSCLHCLLTGDFDHRVLPSGLQLLTCHRTRCSYKPGSVCVRHSAEQGLCAC